MVYNGEKATSTTNCLCHMKLENIYNDNILTDIPPLIPKWLMHTLDSSSRLDTEKRLHTKIFGRRDNLNNLFINFQFHSNNIPLQQSYGVTYFHWSFYFCLSSLYWLHIQDCVPYARNCYDRVMWRKNWINNSYFLWEHHNLVVVYDVFLSLLTNDILLTS